jgi:hypothetical protein
MDLKRIPQLDQLHAESAAPMEFPMKKTLLVCALALLPSLAFAEVKIGDMIGTNGDDAKAALEKAGCPVEKFEAEDGKVEAVRKMTVTGEMLEIVIDPATGAISDIKKGD